jgi:uncharacterized OsmC-like protein
MEHQTKLNGIDLSQLQETVGAIEDQPGLARFTFKARTDWRNGTVSTVEVRDFVHNGERVERPSSYRITGDEPPVLLGSNEGPNAVEMLLGALGACYSVGFAANAAARGIELEELRYEIEGDIDVHNFLGLSEGPRPGFKAIRARASVRSPNATPEQLDELCRYVQETSPVRDNLANPVPVHTELEVVS